MKRFLLTGALMVAIITASFAQSEFKSRVSYVTGTEFTFGPKVGFNFSGISHSGLDKTKFSFLAGVFGEFRLNDNFGLLAEVTYSRQGDFGKEEGAKVWARVNYINIPVLAKFYVLDRLSVETGPQFGIAINGRLRTKIGGVEVKTDIDHLNSIDCSYALGVAYDINESMFISARYNIGLTNVIKKDKFNGENNQNRVFQLSTGFRF